jgi:Growth regulator
MATATLRNLGGSIALTIPKKLVEAVGAQSGTVVDIEVRTGRLIVTPAKRPRYTLHELLAQGKGKAFKADKEWLNAPPVGREAL